MTDTTRGSRGARAEGVNPRPAARARLPHYHGPATTVFGPSRRVAIVRPADDLPETPAPEAAHRRSPASWVDWLLVVGVTSIALLVRVWRLDALGFNSDEVVYAGQAAALAGNPRYLGLFPVFRAHPMLFQSVLSPFFRTGEVDVAGRMVVAVFGVATVLVVYLLGARLYHRSVGVVAALLLAVMPYHVVVTRQVLLDGPMVLFATLSLYCVVRFVDSQKLLWFVASGGMLGLTMLTKETAVVLLGGIYCFLALTPTVRRPLLSCLCALPPLVIVFVTHPVSQMLAGRADTGKGYLVWQLFRRPNHTMGFYLQTVPTAIGLLTLLAAAAGLWWLRRQRSWRETLLLSWVAAPVVAFEVWPVKGFQYLLPVVAPVAVLAARGLLAVRVPRRLPALDLRRWSMPALRLRPVPTPWGRRGKPVLRTVAICVVVASMLIPTWQLIDNRNNTAFLAGSGGLPAGREAGRWLAAHTPTGSVVLTLGPSMANVLEYYGHRQCYGLSVSPNPLHRNPAYPALPNPDRALRQNELQYIVWDSFSAGRSKFFAAHLLALARRYHGRVVHTEFVSGVDAKGRSTRVPVIIIYEVRP